MSRVVLIDYMGDDLRVANVARVSFNKWKEELDEKDVKLINYLANHKHNSPFRHTAITLRCEAPIWLARQLGKHQVGMSWNEISRRYVDNGFKFDYPFKFRYRPDSNIKQGSGQELDEDLNRKILEAYDFSVQAAKKCYDYMLENNVSPEMARMVLPQSTMTTWIWTGSLEAFFHVWKLRSGEGAQEEAKEFAELLKAAIEPEFSTSWKALEER